MIKIIKYVFIASIFTTAITGTSLKENTQTIFDSLTQINQSLTSQDQELWVKAHSNYLELSKLQFNPLLINERPKEFQKLADNTMDKLNKYFVHSSINKAPLPKLTAKNVDGKIFIIEGNNFLKQAKTAAIEQKKLLQNKQPGFVGASSTGEKANELYKKAALEFIKAGKTFNADKKFNQALDAYNMVIKSMNKIGHAPVSPYVHFIDWLIVFDAKVKVNKMATKAALNNFNFYIVQNEAKNLLHLWENKTAQEFITKNWEETNKLFFNKPTLEAEIKTLKKFANSKTKSLKKKTTNKKVK